MEDDDSARINILGGRLGVAEVEALLLQLAQWRQQQQPAVSDRPDQHLNSVLWEVDPMFAVSRSAEPIHWPENSKSSANATLQPCIPSAVKVQMPLS